MSEAFGTQCTAFVGTKRLASGDLRDVAVKVKAAIDHDTWAQPLIFDDATSRLIEVDFRGTVDDVAKRVAHTATATPPVSADALAFTETEPRRPGRPKLGVVAREVTLLPRHWDWLAAQPGGASVALRSLVDHARRANEGKDRLRQAQESAYRFLAAMAGNERGFEDAIRALFAGDRPQFDAIVESWPADVRDHARKVSAVAFEGTDTSDARSPAR